MSDEMKMLSTSDLMMLIEESAEHAQVWAERLGRTGSLWARERLEATTKLTNLAVAELGRRKHAAKSCLPECGDGRHDLECAVGEAEYAAKDAEMRAEFGLRDGMTPGEVKAQLERVKPLVFNADALAAMEREEV